MTPIAKIALTAVLYATTAAMAAPLVEITLAPDAAMPAAPKIGEPLKYRSVITNRSDRPIQGLISWVAVVQVNQGKEKAVELKDWNADKAVAQPVLAPGQQLAVEWPMRPIDPGEYRVVVSAAAREMTEIVTAPVLTLTVAGRPVVESNRVLAISIGLPLLLGVFSWWRLRRRRTRLTS